MVKVGLIDHDQPLCDEDMAPLPDKPFTELPEMFTEALRILDIPQSEGRDAKIDLLAERYPDIAGGGVIRDGDDKDDD